MRLEKDAWGMGMKISHIIKGGTHLLSFKHFIGSCTGTQEATMNTQTTPRDEEKNQRRRSVLQKNTSIASFGYLLPVTAYLIVKIFNLATYNYWNLIIIGLWILISQFVFQSIIHRKPVVTIQFVNMITLAEFANWVAIFSFLISFLNEVRLSALLTAFIGIIFVLPNAGFLPSLLLSSAVVVSYTTISYYQIYYGHKEKGVFPIELMHVFFFFFAALFVAFAAGKFKSQRAEKKLTEIAAAEATAAVERKKAEELEALNQQLRASEQQLRASEQQLRGSNRQLEAKERALKESQTHLIEKLAEVEQFNKVMVGRELTMIKLKEEVNSLLEGMGEPKKY